LYPPLSGLVGARDVNVDYLIFSLHLAGVRSILGRINFMVTLISLRAVIQKINSMNLFV
jgi:cytochrome c oxidase subunit 1